MDFQCQNQFSIVHYCNLQGKKISSVSIFFFFSRMATMRCDCVPVKQRWKQGNPISCCDPCWSAAQFGEWCCCFDKSTGGVTAGFQRLSESTESLVIVGFFCCCFFFWINVHLVVEGPNCTLRMVWAKGKQMPHFVFACFYQAWCRVFLSRNSSGRSILSHSGPIWHPEDVTEVKLAQ